MRDQFQGSRQLALCMLVNALIGLEFMKDAYAYAIEKKYRFHSYGDKPVNQRRPNVRFPPNCDVRGMSVFDSLRTLRAAGGLNLLSFTDQGSRRAALQHSNVPNPDINNLLRVVVTIKICS